MSRPILVMLMTKEIPDGLKNFLAAKQIKCVLPEQYNTAMELTHVVMTPAHDIEVINDQFQVIENDVRVLSVGPVADLSVFLEHNGRLAVDASWFKAPMGKVVLEKFFEGRASVNLDQNFPAVKEHGGFKVTNHLRMGHDMDRLASFVHARNASLVNVRTFVDHAVYYACYLAQAKIGSTPFDVDYGFTGTDTVVQIHLPVRRFLAENLLDCFHAPNGTDPLKYILSICVQSADFTEIQYIEQVGKLVISGLWQQRESKLLGFGGVLLSQIRSSEQIERANLFALTSKEIAPAPVIEAAEAEVLVEKPLPGEVSNPAWEVEAEAKVMAPVEAPAPVEGEVSQVIKGDAPEKVTSEVVKGSAPEKETSQTVKGSKEEKDNFQQKFGGDQEKKDSFQQKIGGGKVENDNFQMKIGAGGEPSQSNNQKMVIGAGGTPAAKDAQPSMVISSGGQGQDKGNWNVKSSVGASGGDNGAVSGGSNAAAGAAAAQIKELESELRKAKSQLEMASKEIKVFKDMRKQMMEIEQKYKQNQQAAAAPADNLEAIDAVNTAENEVRKTKLELQQKQIFFAQELEKNQRLLKSRDTVIEKAKDSLRLLTEKKDKEIKDLQSRLDGNGANQTAAMAAVQQVKSLESEKQSLSRLVDVYKNKLTVMTAKAERQATNPAAKDEEMRKIQMEKQTAQVALTAAQKEIAKLKSRGELDQSEIKRLADEKLALDTKLKAATSLAASPSQNSAAEEALKIRTKELERDLAAQTIKMNRADEKTKELEKKILDMTTNMSKMGANGDSNLKAKVAHLDAAVKKLTQDLTASANLVAEAKKEVNKLRQEKTALQNSLDKAKKDAEKAAKDKPADPKKAA